MTAEIPVSGKRSGRRDGSMASRSDTDLLRALAVAAGIGCSVLFVVIGVWNELEMYGDGSFFSYSVAAQDAWTFWQNMSGRLFVYLFAYVLPQTYVGLTGDASGGVAFYGFLFFVAPLLGLAATYALDRSKGRIFFTYGCASTACLCPLVFGFPTETWMSHALFWPALALCHRNRAGVLEAALIFLALLALVLTHEGALIFAFAILITLSMRGVRDSAFTRALGIFFIVVSIWIAVKMMLPPDEIMADVLRRGALHVFDPAILTGDLVLLFIAVAVFYTAALYVLWRLGFSGGPFYAALIAALALGIYWAWFDQALHAENRYYLRTIIILATPAFGAAAAAHALWAEGKLPLPFPFLSRLMTFFTSGATAQAAVAALALVLLIHTVETAKFVNAWAHYRSALRQLAMGNASNPELGDAHFVSSHRLGAELNRLAWVTTTPFLSVLISPNLAPVRLAVDPYAGFFWLSCEEATENLKADRSIPSGSRHLVQIYSCLHRED